MIEKIDHYSITPPATVYDEEAVTALQLAARTVAKVNECIDAYHDFEKSVDEETVKQWTQIRRLENEVYEFCGNGLPVEVSKGWLLLTELVHKYVDEGKFAEIYDEYAKYIKGLLNELTARLDNFLYYHSPTDANEELVDMRVDCEGNRWQSAGSAVRNITRTLLDRIENFTKPNTVTITPVYTHTGKIMAIDYFPDGIGFTGTVQSGFGHSKLYNVSEGEKYYVSAYYGFRVPDVVFGNDTINPDGITGMPNAIGYANMSDGVMSKNKFDKIIVVPDGATKMLVNWCDNDANPALIEAKKIEGYSVNFEELTEFITTSLEPLESMHPTYTVSEAVSSEDGSVIKLNSNNTISVSLVGDGDPSYKVATYKVKAGQRVRFSCCANFKNLFYYMYNEKRNEIHSYEQSVAGSTRQYVEKHIVVPMGVDRICVAHIGESPIVEYMAGVSGSAPFTGINCCVVGDSVSEFNEKATKNYLKILEEKTGLIITNLANSGAGFLNEKDNNTHYYGQINSYVSPTTDSLYLIMGSGNDLKYVNNKLGALGSNYEDHLYGQMKRCYDTIMTRSRGKARIAFVTPVAWKGYSAEQNNNIMERYVEAMRTFCRTYCVPFLDLYHESGLNPDNSAICKTYFDSEGVHPNDLGHKVIASCVYNFLNGIIGMEV